MKQIKNSGFTVVELMVVIVVIAILATISTIAYRETQKNARNEKRKIDVVMLRSAAEDYYADNGKYPNPSGCYSPGSGYECWRNEVWQILKDGGYLKNIPQPETKSDNSSLNVAANGYTNYGWRSEYSGSKFGIFVQLEGSKCKTGKNPDYAWFSYAPECDF